MGGKIGKRFITIRETDRGWVLISGSKRSVFDSAAALNAVKGFGEDQVNEGISTLQFITWEPSTRIGRIVVEVLCGKTKKRKGRKWS